jgi:NADH dehydrogenase
MAGIRTIVSTASAFLRMSRGGTHLTLSDVDHRGYMRLIAAAEHANVDRFVFVSLSPRLLAVRTPLSAAKLAVEERLRSSSLTEVIVQTDLIQELALNPAARVDWVNRVAAIPGHGDARIAYVAADDVAELLVSIALEERPPRRVEVGGPEQMSRKEAIAILERVLAAPVKRRSAPRFVFRAVAVLARRLRPALSSEFGLVLAADLANTEATDIVLRQRGIEPQSVEAYFRRATSTQ